ncbi:MAG: DUF3025 domain-containing protein [Gammaproteobacteria bacterium]|nr:DUF3025 domain-containing protein [Gammaproteobacteria bacterium]
MRFKSPPREAVAAHVFNHPAFDFCAGRAALLACDAWPEVASLNAAGPPSTHLFGGAPIEFVAQTAELLSDGLHYEQRIFQRGLVATRPANWHDLFNALIWRERFALKCAVNAAYVREFAAAAPGPRSRAQCALTHFDEGGAILVTRDAALVAAWDRHDWASVFWPGRGPVQWAAELLLFGHALLEQYLLAGALPVAKCLVVSPPAGTTPAEVLPAVAQAIARGDLLADPSELRPLPLAGIPGWHPDNARVSFLREAPCFRPLRPGRYYPPPWVGANPPALAAGRAR